MMIDDIHAVNGTSHAVRVQKKSRASNEARLKVLAT
jgi:hypothetical protein